MIHHLQHIVDLVEICRLKGIRHVVISPGSRNSPLIHLFANEKSFILHSIVDERSAGFFALGISLASNQPVILLCTSGTAVLNYSPALAEAYYQHIPLIAITADRPADLIDQQDNQTIRQSEVYQNFIKESICLDIPVLSIEELQKIHFTVDHIINSSLKGIKGPVHINVPINEPLYTQFPAPSPILVTASPLTGFNTIPGNLLYDWQNARKRLILCGMNQPDEKLNTILNILGNTKSTVVLAEPISNMKGNAVFTAIDRIMMLVETKSLEEFKPDILISLGGPVVSKRLKQWLQKQPGLRHYRLTEIDDHINTYKNLTATIIGKPSELLEQLSIFDENSSSGYNTQWKAVEQESFSRHNRFLQYASYTDLSVFNTIMNSLPSEVVLHLGNSTPVRYGQLFDTDTCIGVYANRGVSGIDGCLSTATGFASQSDHINLAILGDLSFLYDSNALWNRNLPDNLRIIVINNQGGGIFRTISNPSGQTGFEEFIEAYHPVDIGKIADAFNISYFRCTEAIKIKETLNQFFSNSDGAALLEIITPRLENPVIYSNYIKNMKGLNDK